MKSITLILLMAWSSVTLAQKCNIESNEVDAFTSIRVIKTDWQIAAKNPNLIKLKVKLVKIGDEIIIYATVNETLGCVKSTSKIILKLHDDSILDLSYNGDINCSEKPFFIGVISPESVKKLNEKPVKAIRFVASSYNDFTPTNPNFLQDLLKCVEKESI